MDPRQLVLHGSGRWHKARRLFTNIVNAGPAEQVGNQY